eukprot:99104_1
MFRSFFLASILAALVFGLGTKKCGKNYCRNVDGDCEKGSVVYNCFVDPCFNNGCAPGTYCAENYCNGCNFVCNSCVDARGKCLDEEGCGVVQCLVDPCKTAQCPKGTACKSNYCGGCNAVCT